eukprot:406959-Pelagomonas_calceolata.AAC.2
MDEGLNKLLASSKPPPKVMTYLQQTTNESTEEREQSMEGKGTEHGRNGSHQDLALQRRRWVKSWAPDPMSRMDDLLSGTFKPTSEYERLLERRKGLIWHAVDNLSRRTHVWPNPDNIIHLLRQENVEIPGNDHCKKVFQEDEHSNILERARSNPLPGMRDYFCEGRASLACRHLDMAQVKLCASKA